MKCNSYGIMFRLLACTALMLCAASAFAEDVKDSSNEGPMDPIIQVNCDLTGYKSEVQNFTPPVSVPDNNAAGVTVGPIVVPADGNTIADVVIDLCMNHTWLGDIVATVRYDETCDGQVDLQSTIICRPGRTVSCGATGTGVGCSSNLVCSGSASPAYLFDDSAVNSLPTTSCVSSTNIPAGCYKPTGLGAGPLSVFRGRPKGGCWTLFVSDNAGADLGTIYYWSVHILNSPPVATEPTSWGNVKILYSGD